MSERAAKTLSPMGRGEQARSAARVRGDDLTGEGGAPSPGRLTRTRPLPTGERVSAPVSLESDGLRANTPSVDEVWTWLAEVPDPEIPVISLVDLGIIRDVAWRDDTLEVTVTPTYSGCPATGVINFDIDRHLREKGLDKIALKRQLSPAWTTDWISAEGREKLRDYGIAPPIDGTAACVGMLKTLDVACPRCASMKTERISQFGSTPCKASWRCEECLEPFDYFKSI